jgi:hypothetical protein
MSLTNPTHYLVHNYNSSRVFAWLRHEFCVIADEAECQYECECKLWEHTGMSMPENKNIQKEQKHKKINKRTLC